MYLFQLQNVFFPNFKMYWLKLHLLWLLSVASQVQDGLPILREVFALIAKCICLSFQMYLLGLRLLWLLPVAGQVFSGRPPQRPVLWPAHCSQKTPHVDFLFDSSLSRLQWLYLLKGISNNSRKEASPRQAIYCSVLYHLPKIAMFHILFANTVSKMKRKQKRLWSS